MADGRGAKPDLASTAGATWQHMTLVRNKLEMLSRTLRETEAQFIATVAREWQSGELSPDDLLDRYLAVRRNGIAGFPARWQAAMPGLTHHRMKLLAADKHAPNGTDGQWLGRWPVDASEPRPINGQAVVYLLHDAAGGVAYVGSTSKFLIRMRKHQHDGKVAGRWQAYPCNSRDEAYAMEQRFLDRHRPYLNRSRYAAGLRIA